MNKINTYGIGHIATKDRLLFVAEIYHPWHCGFAVFDNIKDASEYVVSETERLPNLTLDENFELSKGLMDVYTNCPKEKLFKKGKEIYIK